MKGRTLKTFNFFKRNSPQTLAIHAQQSLELMAMNLCAILNFSFQSSGGILREWEYTQRETSPVLFQESEIKSSHSDRPLCFKTLHMCLIYFACYRRWWSYGCSMVSHFKLTCLIYVSETSKLCCMLVRKGKQTTLKFFLVSKFIAQYHETLSVGRKIIFHQAFSSVFGLAVLVTFRGR